MDVEGIVEELRAIRGDIAQLREDMGHYRGFVVGAAWGLSALAGAVGFIWGILKG